MQKIFTQKEIQQLKNIPKQTKEIQFLELKNALKKYWEVLVTGEDPSNGFRLLKYADTRFKRWNEYLVKNKKVSSELTNLINIKSEIIYNLIILIDNKEFTDLCKQKDFFPPKYKNEAGNELVPFNASQIKSFNSDLSNFLVDSLNANNTDILYDKWRKYLDNKEKMYLKYNIDPFDIERNYNYLPNLIEDFFRDSIEIIPGIGNKFAWSFDCDGLNFSVELAYYEIITDEYHEYLAENWDSKLWKAFFDDFGLFLPNEDEMCYSKRSMKSILDEMRLYYEKSSNKRFNDLAKNWEQHLEKRYDKDTLWQLLNVNLLTFYLFALPKEKSFQEDFGYDQQYISPAARALRRQYSSIIEDKLPYYFEQNLVKNIYFSIRLESFLLFSGNYNPSFGNDISFNHPYFKFHNVVVKEVFMHNEESFNSGEEIFSYLKSLINNYYIYSEGSRILFLTESQKKDFCDWNDYRLRDLETLEQVEVIYPKLVSDEFLTKLDEYAKIGQDLVNETQILRQAILNLTQNTSYDVQNVITIFQDYLKDNPSEIFISRRELLRRWAKFLIKHGIAKKENYLIKTVLPPRLNSVIEIIKDNREKYYYIEIYNTKGENNTGRPETRFYYKK